MAFDFSGLNNISVGTFGEDCTIVATGAVIQAVFDNEGFDVLDIEATQPAVSARTSDISGVSNGDQVQVNGTTYEVTEQDPDSEGMTILRLHEA